jgi:hypothetical protein
LISNSSFPQPYPLPQNGAKGAPEWRSCLLFHPRVFPVTRRSSATGRLNFAQMGFHLVFIPIFAIGSDVA